MGKAKHPYMKKVSEIMKDYDSCYMGGDWEQTLNMFMTFKSDMDTILKLEKVLKKDGVFREPIILSDYVDSYEGQWERVRQVADGTHRLLTAYRLGFEEVLVRDDYFESEAEGNLATTVKFASDVEEEVNDCLTEILRSVYLDDNNWVTASCGSYKHDGAEFFYDSEDTALIPLINKRVSEKVSAAYPDEKFIVTTVLDLFDEDDLF